jgi:hypothetical protein
MEATGLSRSHGCEAFSAFSPAFVDDTPSAFRGHPLTESMHSDTPSVFRSVRRFHAFSPAKYLVDWKNVFQS